LYTTPYTIRITEVGNGKGKTRPVVLLALTKKKKKKKKKEKKEKKLGINVKELLSYTCAPKL